MATEDEILEEFGFDPEKPRKVWRGGRGNVADMTGKIVGLYRCTKRHPVTGSHNGEAQWVVECVRCGQVRIEKGSRFRSGLRCMKCQGRPGGNANSAKNLPTFITDWRKRLDELCDQMKTAIDGRDAREIKRLGGRIARAAGRVMDETSE